MRQAFSSVPVGKPFEYNGNVFVKQSTRTAFFTASLRVFYFKQGDMVRLVQGE